MAEPARNYDPEQEAKKHLSAEERAAHRWGTAQPNPDDESAAEKTDAETGSARDRANERWGMTPDELEAAESSPAVGANNETTDQVGKGYNPKDKPKGNRLLNRISAMSPRKKILGGGIVGGIVTVGFLGSTFLSGPFQFIHISQLLERFHFTNIKDVGNSRILNLYKFTRFAKAGTVENTRLGVVGRRVATGIDGKLARIGIRKQYTKIAGIYESTIIDAVEYSKNAPDGNEYRGLHPEEFIAKFQEKNGIRLTETCSQCGEFVADSDSSIFAFLKNRNFNKFLVGQTGYDNVTGSVVARIMGKRDAVTWHPIKQLDSRLIGALDNKISESKWLSLLKERIKSGETSVTASGDVKTDSKGKTDTARTAENAKAANIENQALKDAANAGGDAEKTTGVLKGVLGSKAGKIALKGTLIVALTCAAKSIGEAANGLKHDMIVLPLIRTAVQSMALGGQLMSGQDIDMAQLGFFSKQLSDPKTGSWSSARSIQAELNEPQTGPDMPEGASIKKAQEGSMFTDFLNSIPGIGVVCKVNNSAFGKAINIAVSAITPISSIVQTALLSTPQAKDALSSLVRWMAGSPIPTFVAGPDFGSYINYGARLAANNSFAAEGGVALTKAESAQLEQYNAIAQKEDLAGQSLAQRIFNPYSPDSLVSKAIDKQSPNIGSNVASFLGSLANPSKFFSILKSPLTQRVSAASTSYDYGFPEIGFSLSDLNSPAYEDPYTNADRAIALLSDPTNGYAKRIEKCFGVKFMPDHSLETEFTSLDPLSTDKEEYPPECSSDKSQAWTSIRFYILDMKTAEAADCYDSGDSQSCQNSGFGSSESSASSAGSNNSSKIVGDLGESSDNVPCATGTKDLGVVQSQYAGDLKKTVGPLMIRLCQITELPGNGRGPAGENVSGGAVVNSRVSGAWQALAKAAKADGVSLTADSSFRLEDSCGGGGDGTRCARPNQSFHQLGIAIDFGMPHKDGISTTTCGASRTRLDGNPMWDWLYPNAEEFGFKQYTFEVWHWDASNTASRCGTND